MNSTVVNLGLKYRVGMRSREFFGKFWARVRSLRLKKVQHGVPNVGFYCIFISTKMLMF